jgi:transcriptional regulator with XRE-family HTH domain
MGTLGTYLRAAREARGLDLRDAAQQTRISIGYLKAIENEDFSKLPGAVFVRGFLKNYARFLGLPDDEVMKRYSALSKPQPAPASPPVPDADVTRAEQQKQKHTPVEIPVPGTEPAQPGRMGAEPFLWAGAIIIGLVVFILTALPAKDHAHKQAGTDVSKVTATGHVQTALTPTGIPEKLYLDIVALDDVWVLVRTDASPQKKATLKKGESVTWSADERFLVSYGSVGAAKLVLNGKELAVNGPKDAVVRDLIITSAGVAFQKVEPEKPKPRKPKPVTQTTPTTQPQLTPQIPVTPVPQAPAPAAPEPAQQPTTPAAPSFPAPRD